MHSQDEKWVAHAPPRVVFGAPAEKACLVAAPPNREWLRTAGPLPGEGAGHSTRGRVRYPEPGASRCCLSQSIIATFPGGCRPSLPWR